MSLYINTCLECGDKLIKSDKYYFCDRCNSKHNTKSNKGCYNCCSTCQDLIIIDSDDDYWCENCGDKLCQKCVVWNEDDEFTYCKDCSNKEEETIYKCLECNQNLYHDIFDYYFCTYCNPKIDNKSKKGYYKRCKACDNFIIMNNKKDFECRSCEGIICENCYIIDEEIYIICKICKEND